MSKQTLPVCIIGTGGHVDHGKTTLVQALSGVWTARHSEELKRGLTMKLGYAYITIYKCPRCPPPQCYLTHVMLRDGRCPHCGSEVEFVRKISVVDVPGHETLMATMIAGATLMDGVLFVIDATVPCPQPQTYEHFMALTIMGVRNIVIVQNKIDVVADRDKLLKHYQQIKKFIEGTWAEDAPIIPASALHKVNVDAVVEAIEERIPTPKRDESKPPRFLIARSFNVNKPGTPPENLQGGVIGGCLIQGKLRVGDEIEIRPGIRVVEHGKVRYEPLYAKVLSIKVEDMFVEEVGPGTLVGIGTDLDPALTRADALIGNVAGKVGTLPPTRFSLRLETHLLERVVGLRELPKVERIRKGEVLMLVAGTATTLGVVRSVMGDEIYVDLRRPVCIETGAKVVINRQIAGRWRLIGYGIVKD
ncbi:MAG: translation initiation factor IF-2 subunit gamma [Thermoprotei archaeon]|nr:MAG: translation initiation factor IF-2 subunit gamma [Thermoprotei archaeon]